MNGIKWIETGDKSFFGISEEYGPVVKLECMERTYYLPACKLSPFYREVAIEIVERESC